MYMLIINSGTVPNTYLNGVFLFALIKNVYNIDRTGGKYGR